MKSALILSFAFLLSPMGLHAQSKPAAATASAVNDPGMTHQAPMAGLPDVRTSRKPTAAA